METVVCRTPGELVVQEVAEPQRRPSEVLLRIRRVGVCGTDYHIFRGTQPYLSYPRVMGHELAGKVVDCDEGSAFAPGQPVCVIPYLSCGQCVACRAGKPNCCARIAVLGVHRDGGLAEYLCIDEQFVVDATGLTLDAAAMVEFLAIGHHAVVRGSVAAGERLLVVGAGPIGMAVTLFAALAGASVTVLDGNAARARFCIEELGACASSDPGEGVAERLLTLSGGDMFDCVFDCTGSAAAMTTGFGYVAHGGRYVLVSVVSADITFSDPEFHKREMTLLGSRNATRDDFDAVIAAMRAGAVPIAAMHTHSAPLADLPSALPRWMEPQAGVIKAIVEV
ncbi:2-desacetyl-2-hydroxyethyl bacteriochlorophyllide A dehydrogenase [Sphingomonas insulae]|uniref:Zinc-binding alcohol dehydrogenase family protein n=1 Tax=Sphingomonas insulae TaxID=424800 RepID=A0ABN1HZM7_9SPHN|nr:zinc-binding alcohol dehydrogenase family protein [Sphingomonas insulae]NIJ31106.1 2-desacetyl-2-hydroxyethyl bacteriochlorophyllide A dehydrogenase [Sphingomonas insulae]